MFDVKKFISTYKPDIDLSIGVLEELSKSNSDSPLYVFGKNECSRLISEKYNVTGVVDDHSSVGDKWLGVPLVRGDRVLPDSIIINCSFSVSPVSVANRIDELYPRFNLTYSDLCYLSPEIFPLPEFVQQARNDFVVNQEHWRQLYSKLFDSESSTVLDAVLKFRLTGDPKFMRDFSVRFHQQYFEEFLPDSCCDVFVDAGGYDGDTTEIYCNKYPDYKKVILFEPSHINLTNAKERLKNYRDIEFLEYGLSDKKDVLSFDPNSGSSSAVVASGDININVDALDELVKESVSFIKMDLEGWEMKALQGSVKHLRNDKPVLAIAVYHDISDFWKIYEYVSTINPQYNIYIRHYTEGWSETIMYFIPE